MNINYAERSFEIQGHRGARGTHPENTLPAFKHAIEAGVNGIEMDLVITKDKVIMIQHSFFVNKKRCQYKDGSSIHNDELQLISARSYSQIKALDGGAKKNKYYPLQTSIPGTEIPTLSELFEMIEAMDHPNARKVVLNLEIKFDPLNPAFTVPRAEFVALLLKNVREYHFAHRVYYSSFDKEVLKEMHLQDVNSRVGYIFDESSINAYISHYHSNVKVITQAEQLEFIQRTRAETGAEIVSPEYKLLNLSLVKALNGMGLKVIPWTVNTQEDKLRLQEMGVAGVITDFPLKLIEERKDDEKSSMVKSDF